MRQRRSFSLLRGKSARQCRRIEGLAHVVTYLPLDGRDLDIRQRHLLLCQVDASRALSSEFERLIEEQRLVRGVAGRAKRNGWVRAFAGDGDTCLGYRMPQTGRHEIEVLPLGDLERIVNRDFSSRRLHLGICRILAWRTLG